jgi:predicted dehydrogenase
MTEAFLMAGKDVLCEKPMALTIEECEKMMEAEKKSGKTLMIGQVCRCTPAFVMAKKMIEEGKIGSLHQYYYATVGNGTAVASAKKYATEIGKKLVDDHVDAVILTST